MPLNIVAPPYPVFTDRDGTPLENGYVYLGEPGKDPETNPVPVFWDTALTIPAVQPIRTVYGYLSRNGTPAKLYANDTVSLTVKNSKQEVVFSSLTNIPFDPSTSARIEVEKFTGNGVQTAFVLTSAPVSENNTQVYINGVYQNKDGYSISGNTLTFTQAPPGAGSDIEVVTFETYTIGQTDASFVSYTASGVGAVQTTVQNKLRETVSVKDFGAVGDGVTDDTAAFQAAIDYISTSGGGTVTFQDKHLIDSNLVIKDYVNLQGPLGLPDELLPSATADYDIKSGVLIVNSAATIKTNDGASLCHCLIIRKGLDLPFTSAVQAAAGILAFAGTAITVGGAGSYFHHMLILGFNKAIYSNNFERIRCEYVQGDCTNGIELRTVFDVAYIENCHFWPWTTAHKSWNLDIVAPDFPVAGSLLTRTGTAYLFSTIGDWSKMTNCFSYGYAKGFEVASCNNVNLIGCGADSYGPIVGNTSVGYTLSGTSLNTLLLGCQTAAQGTGIVVNITNNSGGSARIESCNLWSNDTYAIDVQSGRAVINGNEIRNHPTGINVGASSTGILAVGNSFDTVTTPLVLADVPLRRATIKSNRYFNCTSTVAERLEFDNNTSRTFVTLANTGREGYDLVGRHSAGSTTTPTISPTKARSIRLWGQVYDGVDYRTTGRFYVQAEDAPSAGSTPGQWVFSTTPSGSTTDVERISVNSDGSLTPVTDNVYSCGASGFRWSAIWAANGTIQTSDERTKTDISDASLGLDFVNSLRPVSYKFKVGGQKVVRQVYRDANGNECSHDADDARPAEIISEPVAGTRTHWGLIAQEVKAACDAAGVDFGGWILTDKNNPESQQALRYDQFVAPLIKAVQELSKRIEKLESK